MAYIGKSPVTGKFQKLDDISSGFNDSTTTFAVQSGGADVSIENAQQLLVSIDGVLQEPQTAYTVSSSGITFTEAPNTNATFFAILLGETGAAVPTAVIETGAIGSTQLAANAVTHVKLAANAVGTPQIKNSEVTAAKLATDAVETAKIKDVNVTTAKIANDAVTSLKVSPNIVLRGTTTFMGAAVEKSNVISGNIRPLVIDIDNQHNGILFYTTSSHENSEHTVNFVNMNSVEVGNSTSFVVVFTNNVDTQANITKVQIEGSSTNTFLYSGTAGEGAAGSVRFPVAGTANLDVYSFSVIKTDTSAYSTLVSKTNF